MIWVSSTCAYCGPVTDGHHWKEGCPWRRRPDPPSELEATRSERDRLRTTLRLILDWDTVTQSYGLPNSLRVAIEKALGVTP